MTSYVGGGLIGGSGGGLTPIQELTLRYFYYDAATNTLKADRTISTEPSSIEVGNYKISSGGENLFFQSLSQDINYFPSWTGLRDHSIPANLGPQGILTPTLRQFTPNPFILEPNGAIAPSGVAEYDVTWSVPADINVSIFEQSVVLEEPIDPDDWILYEEGPGVDTDPVTYQQWLTGIDLDIGDMFTWTFDNPVQHSASASGFTRISILKGSQDAPRNLLKVRTGTTNPAERYVEVNYRNWTDEAIMSGVQFVSSSQNILYASQYAVDTSSNTVTLTVDPDSTADMFVVFDATESFNANPCTVVVGETQPDVVLNRNNDMVLFYYDSSETLGNRWKTRDFNAPVSTTTFFDAAVSSTFNYDSSLANNEASIIASGSIVGVVVVDVANFTDFDIGDIVNITVDSTYTAQTPFAYVDRTDSSGTPTRTQISSVLRMQRGVSDWTILDSGLSVDATVGSDDVLVYDQDTSKLRPADFGALIGGSQAITQSLPVDTINASGSNQTVVIPDDCTVISANVDGVELTLDFGDPSALPIDTIKGCFVYCNVTNGGTIKFLLNGFNWVNNSSTEMVVDKPSTVDTRLFNNSSETGGILQILPLNLPSTLPTLGYNNGWLGGFVPLMTITGQDTIDVQGFSEFMHDDRMPPNQPEQKVTLFTGVNNYTPMGIGGSELTTYLYVDVRDGTMVELNENPSAADIHYSYIGNIDYTTTTTPNDTVLAVNNFTSTAYSQPSTQQKINLNHGSFNLSGCLYRPDTGLSITHTEGLGVRIGVNTINDPERPDIINTVSGAISRLFRVYVDSSGSVALDAIDETNREVDPTKYNNNGVLTNLGTNRYTVLYVYHFYGSDTCFVYYSSVNVNSLENALNRVQRTPAPKGLVTDEAELRSAIIVRSGTTDLNNSLDCLFVDL